MTDTKQETKQVGELEKLTPEQAIGLLIQGIKIGQSKGAFTLEDAAVLGKAVAVFKGEPNPAPVPEVSEDPEATEVVETEEVK